MAGIMEEQKTSDKRHLAVTPEELPRYRRLRLNLILIPFVSGLVPLIIMAFFNYYQDSNAFKSENRYTISHRLSNTKRSMQFALEERRAVLSLIARGRSLEELSNEDRLMSILRDLKESFGDFIDLGLIDFDGNLDFYAGPYELKNINYKDQPWFHEVSLRGSYMSDVFMGYRKFPHFVIAMTRELPNGRFYVLRATIDTRLLDKQMYSLETAEDADIFIINRDRVLQTASAFYGNVLEEIDINIPPQLLDREIILERDLPNVGITTVGFASIPDSPFILVSMLRHRTAFIQWLDQRSNVIWFLLLSTFGILVIASYRSKSVINHLRESDTRRAKILHNIEYTNKMATLGRLASGVAHEINNPLAIINEKAGLINDIMSHGVDYPDKDRIVTLSDSIVSSVDRCSRVTHRLLGFGRRMDIQKEQIDLKQLIENVLEFQRSEASHRNIHINIDSDPQLPVINSDRGKLQQVFLNLINNAYAAVDDDGKIDIELKKLNGSEIFVAIKDNGTGITKKDMAQIFEPFFSTKGEVGTGLGLSITKDIIEKLGGIIEVESNVGVGTKFMVNLPVTKVD